METSVGSLNDTDGSNTSTPWKLRFVKSPVVPLPVCKQVDGSFESFVLGLQEKVTFTDNSSKKVCEEKVQSELAREQGILCDTVDNEITILFRNTDKDNTSTNVCSKICSPASGAHPSPKLWKPVDASYGSFIVLDETIVLDEANEEDSFKKCDESYANNLSGIFPLNETPKVVFSPKFDDTKSGNVTSISLIVLDEENKVKLSPTISGKNILRDIKNVASITPAQNSKETNDSELEENVNIQNTPIHSAEFEKPGSGSCTLADNKQADFNQLKATILKIDDTGKNEELMSTYEEDDKLEQVNFGNEETGKIEHVNTNNGEAEKTKEVKSEIGKIDHVKSETGKIDHVKSETGMIDHVKSETGMIDHVKSETGKIEHVKSVTGRIEGVKSGTGRIEDVKGETGKIANMKAETGKIANMKAETGKIENMKAEIGKIDHVKSETGKIGHTKSETAKMGHVSKIEPVKSETAKNEHMKSDTGKIECMKSEAGKSKHMKSETGKVEQVKSDTGKLEQLKSDTGKVEQLKSDTGKVEQLKSETGKVEQVKSASGKVEQVKSASGKVEQMKSASGKVEQVKSETGKIEQVKAEAGDFVSSDPEENADNNNPEWELLKKLETDEERYKAVRLRWRNLVIPNPNKNLTHRNHGYRAPDKKQKHKLEVKHKPVVASRKRTHSADPTEHVPVKRQRTFSCTEVFDRKMVDIHKNLKREQNAILQQHEQAVQNLVDETNHQLRSYPPGSFSDERIRALHVQNVVDLRYKCDNRLAVAESKSMNQLRTLEKAMEEVRVFNSFYQGLEKGCDDALLLTDEQLMEVLEEDHLYECFTEFYNG